MSEKKIMIGCSIIDSSLWFHDGNVCKLFFTMLMMSDEDGIIYANKLGIFHRAHLTRQEGERALNILMSSDPNSTSKKCEGRRVDEIGRGWRIVNLEKIDQKSILEE